MAQQQALTKSNSTQQTQRSMSLTTTQQNLMVVEESPTAKGLLENNFDLVRSVGNSITGILDKPNIAMLKKVVDPTLLELFLATELTRLIDSVNLDQRLNIQGHQIPIIAAQLIESYPVETLEDFVLCFKRGSIGFYGSIYRLDAAVLNEWMKSYLEEKYTLIEAEHSKVKKQETDTAAKVDYKAFIERREKEVQQARQNPKVPDNWNVNELERFKLQYQEKQIFQKKLHRTSSEFYTGQSTADIRVWTDENTGYEIYAKNEQDAERIFNLATNGTKV